VANLVGENFAVEQCNPFGDFGFVGEQFNADAAQFVEHYAACHLCCSDKNESESLRDEYPRLDELAHDERRGHHLEGEVEYVQHVCQQPGVVVLFKFEVHPFRWKVLVAVDAVGFPEADPESFCLIELGRANRNSIFLSNLPLVFCGAGSAGRSGDRLGGLIGRRWSR